jgi:hypothetical protein
MELLMHLAFCTSKTHSVITSQVFINLTLAYRLYKHSVVSNWSYAKALEKGAEVSRLGSSAFLTRRQVTAKLYQVIWHFFSCLMDETTLKYAC